MRANVCVYERNFRCFLNYNGKFLSTRMPIPIPLAILICSYTSKYSLSMSYEISLYACPSSVYHFLPDQREISKGEGV